MYFFTADEHYGHRNIIKYCARPFTTVEEMDEYLIKQHNALVKGEDIVIHAGDFTLKKKEEAGKYINQLNGNHIFLRGSHDYWLDKTACHEIWEKTIKGQSIIVCHYAMRVWAKSHYNSWNLHGHSHGKLEPVGKQWDIGVDNNDYRPVSMVKLKELMEKRPDNPNLLPESKRRPRRNANTRSK